MKLSLNILKHTNTNKADLSVGLVAEALKQLERDSIIDLKLFQTDAQITFLQPREDDKTINRIAYIINQQNTLKEKQINAILKFVNTNNVCKSVQLLSYFGEKDISDCGICSVCLNTEKTNNSSNTKTHIKQIITLLENGSYSSRDLIELVDFDETDLLKTLTIMIDRDMIITTATNTYKLKHT